MIDYMASKTAHAEYEERVRAQVPALVYDGWVREHQPGWASRQGRRLLHILGGGLFAASELLKRERDRVLETPVNERDHSNVAS